MRRIRLSIPALGVDGCSAAEDVQLQGFKNKLGPTSISFAGVRRDSHLVTGRFPTWPVQIQAFSFDGMRPIPVQLIDGPTRTLNYPS